MSLKLFNTLSRKKEKIVPQKGLIKIYTCGPTVYDYPHIGNYRAYVASDILKRYLRLKGIKVLHIMNITDVDDKTIKGSQKANVTLHDFTQKYEIAFFEDLNCLKILPADKFPRATGHIDEMVDIIKKLLEKKLAYSVEGSVYFDVAKFVDYGKLAGIDTKNLKKGASGRVQKDEYDKENAHDFALWKAYTKEDGDVFWDTKIGKGRPGWHIECSAMSMKFLGETFDIHCGGIDLVFPHHQNEIAQSEGSTGKKFARHWMHNEWLLVEGEKMSKSKKNFYTLRDLLAKKYDTDSIRYLLLSTHYKQQLNFTMKGLDAAKNSIERLNEFIRNVKNAKLGSNDEEISLITTKSRQSFEHAMDDDLNISQALGNIFDYVKDINRKVDLGLSEESKQRIMEFMEDINEVLGVLNFSEQKIGENEKKLIEQREKLRNEGKYAQADKIRDRLLALGIVIDDTKAGFRVKLK